MNMNDFLEDQKNLSPNNCKENPSERFRRLVLSVNPKKHSDNRRFTIEPKLDR